MKLANFDIDATRHQLVVDVAFYQMDLKNVVESARKADPELFVEDGAFLPSWSKFAKSPVKAKGFWLRMLRAVFDGQYGHDEVNFDLQRGVEKDSGVYMMFLPGNMKNTCLKDAVTLAEGALSNFVVVPLSGAHGVTNYIAQRKAKEAIEVARKAGKRVLILATCLAQRSFSVGEISAVFLGYDNGEAGATIQKISRGLTPNHIGKTGRIVSLSFDPRRDDKLDSLILQTAVNYKKSHNLPTTNDALALILKTVDIFNCTENGAVKVAVDEYLEEIVTLNRRMRVVGKVAEVEKINDNLRECLLQSNFNRYVPKTDEVAQKGKAMQKKEKKGSKKHDKKRKTEDAELREKIIALCENLDVVVLGTNSKNMAEAVVTIEKSTEYITIFETKVGMPFTAFKELLSCGAINLDLIELGKY